MLKLLLFVLFISPSFGLTGIKRKVNKIPTVTNGRIIGGQEAFAGQWPWAAAIYLTTNQGNYFCGGALISSDFVLTAGQCVDGVLLFTILLGTHELQGNLETIRIATETYFLHPDYNPATLENDVGLIKFRESISYNLYMGKAYLPYQASGAGGKATAIGWGQITDDEPGLVNQLNWVELLTLSNEECRLFFGNQVTDNMLCAQGNYNEGTCIGDSGGPLTQYVSRAYNVIIGVASFVSSDGCESIHPSGYTRIFGFNEWIRNTTGEGV